MNNIYYTPANTANNDRLFADFLSTGSGPNEALQTREVDVPVMMGRTVRATITARTGDEAGSGARACWVDFRDLCEGDRGAADYQVRGPPGRGGRDPHARALTPIHTHNFSSHAMKSRRSL